MYVSTRPKRNGDLIDKYIDGEVELVDFIQQMETKMKDKKAGKQKYSRMSKVH